MTRRLRSLTLNVLLPFLLASGLLMTPLWRAANAQDGAQGGGAQGGAQLGGPGMSSAAQQQVQALLEEKESRTPAQRKISSQLLYTMKARRGESITKGGEVKTMRSTVSPMDSAGRVEVDIKGKINKELIEIIEKTGGEILYVSERAGSVRARLPMESLEDLASLTNVRNIRPASRARTHRQLNGERRTSPVTPRPSSPSRRPGLRPNFAQRASSVSAQLSTALPALARTRNRPARDGVQTTVGAVTSEGDVSHRAALARNVFNVSGMGVKIGVLSDSVDFLEDSIASGDLPADVVVLEGQSGTGEDNTGEGTAMLEIIHDLAPGAKLFFATAFNGIESFADNIRALREQGCDIIVDDIIYGNESPFQDDIVAAAVEEVTNDGALYFSSASNDGNFNDGTSSVWEGDFKNSQTTLAALPGGTLHDFGTGVISNRVESNSNFILALFWSDPLGASTNDYDLFIMDSTLTTVIAASTDVQDGDDDPIEGFFPGAEAGTRLLIFKKNGAQRRALHLNNFGGQLGISTPGSTHGHNSVAKAFGVAAINAAVAGGGAFTGGPTNPVELFSSDGFRRVFFKSDGTPFRPGRFLFSNNGGELRRKPDLTAADGVATTVPGFEQFFGTSAAAPHAAAIAALLKSARPRISPNRIRQALTQTALDIEARGIDRDSGAGIVDAFAALQFIEPTPFLELGTVTTTPTGGDDDDFIEPGEGGAITARLVNIGGATATGVRATLTTSTPGVTITNPSANYPNIGANGQSATNNRPLAFTLAETAICGLAIDFTLTVNDANSNSGPQVFTFQVSTGQPGTTGTTISYAGPPVEIVDDGEVSIPLEVSGLTNAISDLNLSFDGSTCTSVAGAPTVGLDHTWVGDLVITLTSPQGTTVTLASRPGGTLNGGNNFCNTVFDDSATALIQRITSAGAPYTGSFKPANPLAAFNGENANGTWVLNVTDAAAGDVGNVRAFSLVLSTFACDTP